MRRILESHFISPAAFDILLRSPFTASDFEAFVAERQRTLQDAIENLLIKERLDLSPQLRDLDAATEQLELELRSIVEAKLDRDTSRVPSHVLQKVDERIARAVKKNAAPGRTTAAKLSQASWNTSTYESCRIQLLVKGHGLNLRSRFGTKEALITKFDQLAELRNGIRHSRDVSEVVRKEGEAAIVWFRQVFSK